MIASLLAGVILLLVVLPAGAQPTKAAPPADPKPTKEERDAGRIALLQRLQTGLDKERTRLEREGRENFIRCGLVRADDHAENAACQRLSVQHQADVGGYRVNLAAYRKRKTDLEEIDWKLDRLEPAMKLTRTQIESHAANLRGFSEGLDEWSDLPQAARERYWHGVIDMATSVTFEVIGHRQATALSAEARQKAGAYLDTLRAEGRANVAAEQALATMAERMYAASAEAHLMGVFTAAKDALTSIAHLPPDDRERVILLMVKGVSGVNALTLRIPAVALITTGVEVGMVPIYAVYARRATQEAGARIDELLQFSEDDRSRLDALCRKYKAQVGDRKALLAERAKLL